MNLLIRPEARADRPAVRAIIEAAFRPAEPTGRPVVEAVLNDELWLDPDFAPTLTLVAERDGEVIGQVTSSYGLLIDEQNQRRVIGVGPVSVLPGRQGAGVGSALMRALVTVATDAGEPALVLLGSPDFYGRFGFVPATDLGIQAPDPAWGKYFQAIRLTPDPSPVGGQYRYAAPFDRL